MTEEELKERVIRLEEKLDAADKALQLAYSNTHGIRAEALSIVAILVSVFAVFRR